MAPNTAPMPATRRARHPKPIASPTRSTRRLLLLRLKMGAQIAIIPNGAPSSPSAPQSARAAAPVLRERDLVTPVGIGLHVGGPEVPIEALGAGRPRGEVALA